MPTTALFNPVHIHYVDRMRVKRLAGYARKIANAWLVSSVHFDAFRYSPSAYLTASKWWVLRKRVRARGQFAPLLSQSPKAYTLWALRDVAPKTGHCAAEPGRRILALVDVDVAAASGDISDLVQSTLQSLADENIPWLLIGPGQPTDPAAKIDGSQHDWLMPMMAGDRVAAGAAAAYGDALSRLDADPEAADVVYADDDRLDRHNRRCEPHFKPGWNSELFQYYDYISCACIVRAAPTLIEAMTWGRGWTQRLVTQSVVEHAPVHLQKMLHHRKQRVVPKPTAVSFADAEPWPSVTVIIPTRNRVDLLRTCLDGIAATDYPAVDVIIVDNESDDPETLAYLESLDPARHKVLRHCGAFNYSALNNHGAAIARGQLLCLLNNDIEVLAPDWLKLMVLQAVRDDVGAVGARLLYPDGRIQHAGVVIGVGNAAGHAHRFVRCDEEGYFHRHTLPQFTSAVTGACLLVTRDRFFAVGGLDEHNFPVAFNDVDLCLRLNQRGWQSLYEPRATLIHHESVSRGFDRDPIGAARFASELAALQRIWRTAEIVDPWHHPQLSRAAERFSVAI